jgi:hypothetical protein
LPEAVDLVLIVVPASGVPGVVADCVGAKARSIVVMSAGFKEKEAEGAALEKEIQRRLEGSATRLIGPNCLGVMISLIGLNATFAEDIARPGNVAFLSQSWALLTGILDSSLGEQVGFSANRSSNLTQYGKLLCGSREEPLRDIHHSLGICKTRRKTSLAKRMSRLTQVTSGSDLGHRLRLRLAPYVGQRNRANHERALCRGDP